MARLHFVDDNEPGIRRSGTKRLTYRWDSTGRAVRDKAVLDRIRALAIPPAWTDVWICADPDGHLQATGRDARGRKQYRYHPDFRAQQEENKYDQLLPFGQALGALRARVDNDLGLRGMPRDRVVAVVIGLLDRTAARIGNEGYVAENKTYGLTTLRDRHATFDSGTLRLRYTGKGGKQHDVRCTDTRLNRLVRRCQDLPGQILFQYLDDDENPQVVTSQDVNDYLREATDLDDVSAKTFRTWGGTVLTASGLAALPPPETVAEQTSGLRSVLEDVSCHLGNTLAVCRASYVHPRVLELWEDGSLPRRWSAGPRRAASGLSADERRLLRLLSAGRRARTRPTRAA
jgi:DNA topoisomerase I